MTALAETAILRDPYGSGITVQMVEINRHLATLMLGDVSNNRDLRHGRVDQYVRAMLTGRNRPEGWWDYIGDPIIYDTNGDLRQGQHRLRAIVETGEPASFLVMRGMAPDAFASLDTGLPRQLRDLLSVEREPNAGILAPAILLLISYQRSQVMAKVSSYLSPSPTIAECMAWFRAHPGLRESATPAGALQKALHGGTGRWAAIHWVLSSIDNDDAAMFLHQLATGLDLCAESPIYHLRKRLIDNYHSLRHFSSKEYTALVFKSWNLWRSGDTVQHLLFRAGGATPERYPVPR